MIAHSNSDSTLIIDKLVEERLFEDLNADLSATEKAHGAGLRALLEDQAILLPGKFSSRKDVIVGMDCQAFQLYMNAVARDPRFWR